MIKYQFEAEIWLYQGYGAWHFVTLPKKIAKDIKKLQINMPRKGFGSVKVEVQTGCSVWLTSIFPDASTDSYLLPMKKQVLKENSLQAGDTVRVIICIITP